MEGSCAPSVYHAFQEFKNYCRDQLLVDEWRIFMIKLWIANLFIGAVCVGIISGCAFKPINPEKVNKEMIKSKKYPKPDKIFSNKKIFQPQNKYSFFDIEEANILDEKSNMDEFDLVKKVIPSNNKSNPFLNLNSSNTLNKETNTKLLLTDKLEDVFFGLDQYNLDKSAREILVKNAEWLRQNPHLKVKLEGHCDERGTNNYNIALGTRRALYVRRQLAFFGISMNRLQPISYGEEKPVCQISAEKCWRMNRRVRFLISSN